MSYEWSELLKAATATLALPCFLVAPGYLAATATDLLEFRTRTMVERLLWATVLSLPISLLLALHPGIGVSPRVITFAFVALAVGAAAVIVRDARSVGTPHFVWDKPSKLCVLGVVALVLYCLAATMPIQTAHGLYESSAWQDWSVRIPLVDECLRTGGHPSNPMFALRGVAAPAHYYYYWYILCAQISLLTHAGARAALAASCVGAAMSFVACVFLALKYMRVSTYPLRRQCVAAMLTMCVLGLDILPVLLRLVLPYKRFYPDPQFWLDDRSDSWLHLMIWSPHHIAGPVCCLTATMLIVLCRGRRLSQQMLLGSMAGIFFAGAVGASTFVAALFALAWGALLVDAVLRREWETPRAMAAAAVIALLCSLQLIHSAFSQRTRSVPTEAVQKYEAAFSRLTPHSTSEVVVLKSAHNAPIKFAPRYQNEARMILRLVFQFPYVSMRRDPPPPRLLQRALRPPTMVLMFLTEFGFLLFPLAYRAKVDFAKRGNLDRPMRVWWILFASIAVPGFFLTSSPIGSNNDLGRHAGMCLKLILLLWAAPMVAQYLWRSKDELRSAGWTQWTQRLAMVCFVLGLAGEAIQVFTNRFDMQLVQAQMVPANVVAERVPQIGLRFNQIRLAMDAAAKATSSLGIVQMNPATRMGAVYLLYTKRRMAASDEGCNVPFGGSIELCLPLSGALFDLYGGSGKPFQGQQHLFVRPYLPQAVTPAAFQSLCHEQNIAVLIATYSDPVWSDRQSWVWALQPFYANATSRAYACGAPPAAGSPS